MSDDIIFRSFPEPPRDERLARLIGPDDPGLKSRIDVYLHDGQDANGEEYGARATLAFDDAMVERAACAIRTEAGGRGVRDKDWRAIAEQGLRAALTPGQEQ